MGQPFQPAPQRGRDHAGRPQRGGREGGITGARPPVCSFPPIASRRARVLVLGSMPGAASLLEGQYYAYRHNAFWPIMGELFGAKPQIAYARRILVLKRAGLALWDVMASCVRAGSLDAHIDEASIVPNDFLLFFTAHPRLRQVFFNGARAEHCFNRYVRPHLSVPLSFKRLPSTSPAHAGMSFARKLQAWRAVGDALQEIGP